MTAALNRLAACVLLGSSCLVGCGGNSTYEKVPVANGETGATVKAPGRAVKGQVETKSVKGRANYAPEAK